MHIEIDPAVADDPDAHQRLDRILYRVDDGWHVWDTAVLLEPEEQFEATTWISNRGAQGAWVREILVASTRRGAWTSAPHGRRVRVTAAPVAANELTPEYASRLADEPLVIVVENRISDGAFIKRVVNSLDHGMSRVWARGGAPIRIDSLGGKGQMRQEIERRVNASPFRPRLVAVIDSDRRTPGEQASETARQLARKCDELNLPCWVLAKREAENYLPRILLEARENAGAAHAQRVDAWDRLSDDGKDFYDMKDGLSDEPSAEEEALYDGLAEPDRTRLTNGFGDNVYKCWDLWSVQAAAALSSRGRGDLEHGIALIRQEV